MGVLIEHTLEIIRPGNFSAAAGHQRRSPRIRFSVTAGPALPVGSPRRPEVRRVGVNGPYRRDSMPWTAPSGTRGPADHALASGAHMCAHAVVVDGSSVTPVPPVWTRDALPVGSPRPLGRGDTQGRIPPNTPHVVVVWASPRHKLWSGWFRCRSDRLCLGGRTGPATGSLKAARPCPGTPPAQPAASGARRPQERCAGQRWSGGAPARPAAAHGCPRSHRRRGRE